jgi:hypothetical protein
MNAYVVQMGSKPRKEGRCCKDVAVHQNSAKDDDHDHAAATIAAAQHCSSSQAGREGGKQAGRGDDWPGHKRCSRLAGSAVQAIFKNVAIIQRKI